MEITTISFKPHTAVSTVHIHSVMTNSCYDDAVLIHTSQSLSVKVLFGFSILGHLGTSSLHILFTLSTCNIPRQRNRTHFQITTIQGKPVGNSLVHWRTSELTLQIGCLHKETLTLLILEELAVERWLSSWDDPGWLNTNWTSGGCWGALFSGATTACNTACDHSQCLPQKWPS